MVRRTRVRHGIPPGAGRPGVPHHCRNRLGVRQPAIRDTQPDRSLAREPRGAHAPADRSRAAHRGPRMTIVASEDVRARAPSDRLPDAAELATALETATRAPEGTIRVTSVRQLKTN